MMADFPYKAIPGRLRGWIRKASLWEGSDHVLLIRGTRFQEDYRRFYYAEIQSLQMVRSFRWSSFGWTTLALFFGLILFALAISRRNATAMRAESFIAAFIVGQALLAWRFGCRCFVQTAVSREELTSLIRTWSAEKAFTRLRTRIMEAQGALPENLSGLLDQAQTDITPQVGEESVDNSKKARVSVGLALIAFVLFLTAAAATYPALLRGPSAAAATSVWRFFAPIQILLMTAAVVSSLFIGLRVRRLKTLRLWLIAALVIETCHLYASVFLRSLFTTQRSMVTMNIVQLTLWQNTMRLDVLALLLLGIGGIIFTLLHWDELHRGDS